MRGHLLHPLWEILVREKERGPDDLGAVQQVILDHCLPYCKSYINLRLLLRIRPEVDARHLLILVIFTHSGSDGEEVRRNRRWWHGAAIFCYCRLLLLIQWLRRCKRCIARRRHAGCESCDSRRWNFWRSNGLIERGNRRGGCMMGGSTDCRHICKACCLQRESRCGHRRDCVCSYFGGLRFLFNNTDM